MGRAVSSRLLVVDAGNTNIVVGLFEGERLVASWRLATVGSMTVDELRLELHGLFACDGLAREDIAGAVLASVVPPLTETLRRGIELFCGRSPLVIRPGVKTGMRLLYDHPEEVGADRIVNSVAAYSRVRGAVVVVDFGTATTFDCVSASGDYLGGVIAPGLGISAEALFRSAARLPRVEVARPPRVIGKSTVAAMQAGLYFGYAGLVDGILERVVAEMGDAPRVLATGGLSELIAASSRLIEEAVPHLTLDGLRILHERNR
jgi:type III pantothenate kinase